MSKSLVQAIKALPRDFPGMDRINMIDQRLIYLMGCMRFDQFCCTWRALENPELFCPFCPAELNRRGRVPITASQDWALFSNEFPRDDTEKMLLIIPRRHLVDPMAISENDMRELFSLAREAIFLHVPSGALVMRFGDPLYHAGTIPHLHANIIRPTPEGGCSLPIAKHVGGPYGHVADYARTFDFVKQIDERGGVEWLFSTEGIIETQPPITA